MLADTKLNFSSAYLPYHPSSDRWTDRAIEVIKHSLGNWGRSLISGQELEVIGLKVMPGKVYFQQVSQHEHLAGFN